jgi:hypothetical protein
MGEEVKYGEKGKHIKGYNDWRFNVNLYSWLYGLQGDVTGKGRTQSVDITLDDTLHLLDEITMVFMGRFEISKGPCGLYFDGTFLKLEDSGAGERQIKVPILIQPTFTINGKVDVTAETSFNEGAFSYDVYTSPCMVGNMPELTLEVLGGARYTYLRSKVHLEIQGPLGNTRTLDADNSRDWVDPIVGGRLLWRPTQKWLMSLRTDVGGFGLGSDITFNINAEVAYRIYKGIYANAGYRALYMDYETGSGNDKFAFDMWIHGPWMGLGVEF